MIVLPPGEYMEDLLWKVHNTFFANKIHNVKLKTIRIEIDIFVMTLTVDILNPTVNNYNKRSVVCFTMKIP